MWRASATVLTEVSGERQRGVWARQSGGGGGQDEAFPVACSTATNKNRNGDITRVTNVIHPNAKIMHKEKKKIAMKTQLFRVWAAMRRCDADRAPIRRRVFVYSNTASSD